jgi:hypothetical protein
MVKVMKSFAILTISKLWSCSRGKNCRPCLFWSKNIWGFAYVSPENFLTTPPRQQHFRETFLLYLVKILGKVGQNMTTPPPPQCWCHHDVPDYMQRRNCSTHSSLKWRNITAFFKYIWSSFKRFCWSTYPRSIKRYLYSAKRFFEVT